MTANVELISVDTHPSKEVVVNSLTRDISIDACIFDLVDNSIDAARDTLFKMNPDLDQSTPPESYEKFTIRININGTSLAISDNCGGIPAKTLEDSVLRFGERSAHQLGIGVFGVGLNRAIFKIGKHTILETDNGLEKCRVEIKTDEYLKSKDWNIPAQKTQSSRKIGTTILTSELSHETSQLFADSDWLEKLKEETATRYGRFIEKGLSIVINEEEVPSKITHIRADGPYSTDTKFFKAGSVSIHIEAGQHVRHRFSAEPGYDKDTNGELTNEYGWTIYCNERAIVISDRTWKTGWVKKFHSEFYGFVGSVYFTSANPAELPWNTTKTDVDLNNRAYQLALEDMKKFVEKWRKNAGDAKRRRIRDEVLVVPTPTNPQAPGTSPTPVDGKKKPKPGTPASNPAQQKPIIKPPVFKQDHNVFSTVLPQDIDEIHCDDKHLALVHEAKRMDLNTMTYTGLVLIRMLFESSTVKFLMRRNKYDHLMADVIHGRNQSREKKGLPPLSEKEVKGLEPDLDELVSYLTKDDEIWDSARKNKIQHSLRKFLAHKKLLNSAAHNTFQTINKLSAFEIREDILPALRYLIEE